MNRRIVKFFALGGILAYGMAALVVILSARLGVLPVQADVTPSRIEATLLGSALRASVVRHAPNENNPVSPSEEHLIAGAQLYRQMCSRCHGASSDSENLYGRSFYPPAPRLLLSRPSYTDSQMFWLIKHGIRNTAMPAWGSLLSDDDIWKVVTFIQKADLLTDSASR
jgi:mono/diheme cytochrome c family protein